ncbi:hypothetical protein BJ170DRAFT_293402 [Xylariales sp. AK1849]|nr:hypothetical protein BJ170DRAFT_293402 [Xylariales sp. AK1849]
MADPKVSPSTSTPPGHRTMRRPLRSMSQSPSRQRLGDALLSRLSPTSAVEALRAPSGALKTCLDDASASEQLFAMRAAVASKKIHDWLDELAGWPWPAGNTSAGFEMPPAKRRKLSEPREPPNPDYLSQAHQTTTDPVSDYLGSLPAKDVTRLELRVEQIQKDMDELDLEEIKTHVLHNHIMPLSRPGTPFSDAGRSVASSISFTKMEDLTAVVTAITIRALPNLSKLSRLLNTWSVRIVVLRKIPSVLMMITDAVVAMRSGWNAINTEGPPPNSEDSDGDRSSILSREDFEVMKLVLQQKVARPGRDLDYMLDALEGMEDTLPDEWLDQMDAIEKDYTEWVATAERRVREGEWAHLYGPLELEAPIAETTTPRPKIQIQIPSPTRDHLETSKGREDSSPSTPFDQSSVVSKATHDQYANSHASSEEFRQGQNLTILVNETNRDVPGSVTQVLDLSKTAAHQHDVDSGVITKNLSLDYDGVDDGRPITAVSTNHSSHDDYEIHRDNDSATTSESQARHFDRSADQSLESSRDDGEEATRALSEVDRNIIRIIPPEVLSPSPNLYRKSIPDLEGEYSFLESVYEDEEPELPPARLGARRDSHGSIASTTLYDPASNLGHSDNDPYREESVEPELPRLPDPDEPFSSDALSPPSSPPLRYKPRSTSISFNEIPEISTLPEQDDTPPRSPLEPPEIFDPESSFDYGAQISSPGRMSFVSNEGDQLHHQISEVLKSMDLGSSKIRLTTKPSAINLNPPDLQLPTRPKSKTSEPFRRSGSALSTRSTMSSRAGTPSFLLAPARAPRPQSRASHDAKTYYLSRSTGEAPMKLLIRCVGENGERVMVRVGGGWADLGEYLREYAVHHGRRSKGEGKVEVKDLPVATGKIGSSPPSRPGSALTSPMTPLAVRKTRKSLGEEGSSRMLPATPLAQVMENSGTPSSDASVGSRGSRFDPEDEEKSVLGLSGPNPKKVRALSEESRQWVEDVKTKVRTASGEQRMALEQAQTEGKFGDIGKVGGTKRVFRKRLGTPH